MQIIRSNFSHSVFNFFFNPLVHGMYGFALFFTGIIAVMGVGCLVGTVDQFIIDTDDILLSLWGFVLLFALKLLKNINNSHEI